MKTGIITALSSEARCLTDKNCKPGIATQVSSTALVVLSGMGLEHVENAIEVLRSSNVELLVSFGTAAALDPGLKSGDVVLPANVILANKQSLNIASTYRERILQDLQHYPFNVHTGDMCESKAVIGNPAEKLELFNLHSAIALDMESGIIASAAAALQLPMIVLRIVVDEADTSIPHEVLECCDEYGNARPLLLALAVLKKPRLLRRLITLGKHYGKARKGMTWLSKNIDLISDSSA